MNFKNNSFLIYAAGFFDGEGSIHIIHQNSVRLTASNTKKPVIKSFCNRFGGNVHMIKVDYRIRKGKVPAYRWVCPIKNREKFLKKVVIPYSIIKKKQAKLALQFLTTKAVVHRYPLPLKIKKVRRKIQDQIYKLNRGYKKEYV